MYDAGIIAMYNVLFCLPECINQKFGPGTVEKHIKTIKRTCNQKCIDKLNKTVKVKEEVNTKVAENTQNSFQELTLSICTSYVTIFHMYFCI